MRRLIAPDKIVRYLLEKGEANRYEMNKGIHLSYSRIHESIPKLLKSGLVEERKVGKSRAGLTVTAYKLTLEGLTVTLRYNPEKWEEIDVIADRHKTLLPLIFGKWNYFSLKSKFKRYIIKKLKAQLEVCADAITSGIDLSELQLGGFLPHGKNLGERITRSVLIPTLPFLPSNWVNGIAGDPELVNFVLPILERESGGYVQLSKLRWKQFKAVIKAHKQGLAPQSRGEKKRKERKKDVKSDGGD